MNLKKIIKQKNEIKNLKKEIDSLNTCKRPFKSFDTSQRKKKLMYKKKDELKKILTSLDFEVENIDSFSKEDLVNSIIHNKEYKNDISNEKKGNKKVEIPEYDKSLIEEINKID